MPVLLYCYLFHVVKIQEGMTHVERFFFYYTWKRLLWALVAHGILSHQPLSGPSHHQRAAAWSSAGWLAPEDAARVLADGSCVCAVTGVSTLERDAAVFQEVFQGHGGLELRCWRLRWGRWGGGEAEFSQTLFAPELSCLSEAAGTRISSVFVRVGVWLGFQWLGGYENFWGRTNINQTTQISDYI